MAAINTFFFDSYAFHEIIKGNPNYEKYASNIAMITTKLNLMELHYGILLKHGKEMADQYFDQFSKYCVSISNDAIKNANDLKASLKKRKLSYVDCIGYIIAKARNVKFLTGDMQCMDMDNVEFVK